MVVSRTYAVPLNQRRLAGLSTHFDVTCATVHLAPKHTFGVKVDENDTSLAGGARIQRFKLLGRDQHTQQLYRNLRSIFREKQYDAVLFESEPWSFAKWQSLLLTRLYQPNAAFLEFTWENIERTGIKGAILKQVYRSTAKLSDLIVVGSESGRTLWKKLVPYISNIEVAPQLGVDLQDYFQITEEEKIKLRNESNLPERGFVIGYCGRFIEEKGIIELIEAVKQITTEYPNRNVTLCLMGRGEGAVVDYINSNIRDSLVKLEPRSHAEVPSFLQMLDLFVLPSKTGYRNGAVIWEEQFGHVLIEAMACGVPCIGSNSGAIPEVLGDESLAFEPGNENAIAEILRKLLNSPSLLESILQDQLLLIENKYSIDSHGAHWSHLIHKAIDNKIQV